MESNKIRKDIKKHSWFLNAVLIVFIGISCLVGGYFFGIWQSGAQNYENSVKEVIKSAPNYITDKTLDSELFWKVWQSVKEKYVDRPVNDKQLFYGALKGMVSSLNDPYSIFLDPDSTKEFNKELNGSFEGIGAEIGKKHDQLQIIAPLDNSPAFAAGLKAGDQILKIDGVDTSNLSLEEAVNKIRGPKGTKVVLTVYHPKTKDIEDISIKRDIIKVDSVSWKILEGNIAYIKITQFNSETFKEFKNAVNSLLVNNPNGLILDLRNNPGGYLQSAIDISGEFLGSRTIVIEDFNKDGKQNKYSSNKQASLPDIKLAVLVNEGSASASEIVAGALQDYQRGTIIGTQTFGKGSVQEFEQFKGGSSLKITVAKWLTPKGRSIQDDGITPDIQVDLTQDDYENDKDPQLDAAISYIK